MAQLLMVGAGGFVGAIARYTLSNLVMRLTGAGFPYGTLAVNVVGCFLIGYLMHLVAVSQWFGEAHRLALVVGLLGSLTTFSTFGYETLALFEAGDLGRALMNVLGNLLLGLFAVVLGRGLATLIHQTQG